MKMKASDLKRILRTLINMNCNFAFYVEDNKLRLGTKDLGKHNLEGMIDPSHRSMVCIELETDLPEGQYYYDPKVVLESISEFKGELEITVPDREDKYKNLKIVDNSFEASVSVIIAPRTE